MEVKYPLTLAEYKIKRRIGEGNYGKIYKAVVIKTGEKVALKATDSMENYCEYHNYCSVGEHENIVKCYGSFHDPTPIADNFKVGFRTDAESTKLDKDNKLQHYLILELFDGDRHYHCINTVEDKPKQVEK